MHSKQRLTCTFAVLMSDEYHFQMNGSNAFYVIALECFGYSVLTRLVSSHVCAWSGVCVTHPSHIECFDYVGFQHVYPSGWNLIRATLIIQCHVVL